jgi:hypothetical protein
MFKEVAYLVKYAEDAPVADESVVEVEEFVS